MEQKNLNRKYRTKSKKPSFLQQCLFCIMNPEEDEDPKLKDWTTINLQASGRMASKENISLLPTTSSYSVMQELVSERISPKNALLSQAYTEKIEKKSYLNVQPFTRSTDSTKNINKEEKDQLVKTILSKYLAMKREEMLNKPEPNTKHQKIPKTPSDKKFDINVDYGSNGTSDILILEGVNKKDTLYPTTNTAVTKENISCPRTNAEFPTKSKSAPTNSIAHDSLADICFKMNRFRQQEKSDSYVTCCSDQTSIETSKPPSKKKLELIFNASSEENFTCLEDGSSTSLQYEICQRTPVPTGILRTDSHLQKYSGYYDYMTFPKGTKPVQELYLHPFNKGQMDSKGSVASLKWKLVISHHDQRKRGDFR